jgi:ribonuclease Z
MALFAVTGLTACDGIVDKALERTIKKELERPQYGLLDDPGMHIVMAGTGSPRIDPERGPPCVVVIAGGEFLLFDAGEACIRRIEMMDLPIDRITGVFVTHLHSDHIGGLGQAINRSWIWGRANKLDVYGPQGIAEVIDGITKTYMPDTQIRTTVQGDHILDPDHAVAQAKPIILEHSNAESVFERNGVVVKAFLVEHQPAELAFGYRIEYKGRSVVISGDTRKSNNVVRNSKDADILIHEAMNKDMVRRAAGMFRKLGNETRANHVLNVIDYHTHTIEVAEVARDAGVDTLVLTHIIPPLLNTIVERKFSQNMDDVFKGDMVVAKDGMRFYLKPKG